MATRRKFLQAAAGGALAARSLGARAASKQPGGSPSGNVPKGQYAIPADAQVPTRMLGRTGVRVSIVGLGGFHLGLPATDEESTRLVRTAIDHGMNFLDNCWDYNGGKSEERAGKALREGYRQKAFLMTKLDGRTARSAREQLEQSLLRLQTDVIDLVQIHEVIRKDDPERCFAKGGTIEALLEAKKAGKLRFIGFTGHKDPAIHLHMLEVAKANGFRFDTVQLPLNLLDAHYRSFEHAVLPSLIQDGIGILGMKSMGAGLIVQSGAATAQECLHYAMSVPGVSVTITGCESDGVLEQALWTALHFKPLAEAERKILLARTAPYAQDGKLEKFKTTQTFDGTEQHKHWLTTARL